MSKYSELRDKLNANHSICESIQKELDQLTPDEVFVVEFQKQHGIRPALHFSLESAKKDAALLQLSITRFILAPEPENEAAPKP